jgi:hypothetical protein
MLLGVDFHLAPREVVIVSDEARADLEPFLDVLRTTFAPNKVVAVVAPGTDREGLEKSVP